MGMVIAHANTPPPNEIKNSLLANIVSPSEQMHHRRQSQS